jgi:hypothetical protein
MVALLIIPNSSTHEWRSLLHRDSLELVEGVAQALDLVAEPGDTLVQIDPVPQFLVHEVHFASASERGSGGG